jgi:hypothetical protein
MNEEMRLYEVPSGQVMNQSLKISFLDFDNQITSLDSKSLVKIQAKET